MPVFHRLGHRFHQFALHAHRGCPRFLSFTFFSSVRSRIVPLPRPDQQARLEVDRLTTTPTAAAPATPTKPTGHRNSPAIHRLSKLLHRLHLLMSSLNTTNFSDVCGRNPRRPLSRNMRCSQKCFSARRSARRNPPVFPGKRKYSKLIASFSSGEKADWKAPRSSCSGLLLFRTLTKRLSTAELF